MPRQSDTASTDEGFLESAAAAGLDISDANRMADLQRRVAMMRQGLARLNEINVEGAESPSFFVPTRR